jgi:hypothetical protein
VLLAAGSSGSADPARPGGASAAEVHAEATRTQATTAAR